MPKLRALAIAAAVGLAACTGSFAKSELKVGYVPSTEALPSFIARDKGFFQKRSLKVKLTRVAPISHMPAILRSNGIQIGMITAPVFLHAIERGFDLVAVGGLARYDPEHSFASLVAHKDAGIKRPADLKGKKIGVPDLGSLLDVTFRRYLIKHGVRLSDVTMIEAASRQMGDLLRGRQLDAVLVSEPFRSRLLGDGAGVQVANFLDEVLKNQIMAFWIAERRWARQSGPVLAKFKEAVQDGVAVLKTDEAQARDSAKKYFAVDAKDLPSYEVSLQVQDFKFYQELGKEVGLLKGSSDPAKLILQ